MGLSKTGMKVLWNAKCSKLPVESDWTCKTSQNVQKLIFIGKLDDFSRKNMNSSKSLKIAKLS